MHVVWNAVAQPGLEWQVYRASEGQEEFEPVARVCKPEYIDTTAEYGKTYRYRVEAVSGNAVSLPSQTVSVLPEDRFPPAIPTGLVGLAGLNTIELTWDRNTEEDLRGYRVYRAGKTGEFMAVSDIIETPAFSDRALESGMTYRYRVAAIDQKMNESKPSEPLEVSAP